MRRLLLSAIASLLVFAASAQTVFKGNVKVADKGTAIGYATVAAVRDSLVLAATSSTSAGFFELAVKGDGKCKIEVSSVGYSPVVKEVSLGGGTVDLGDIFLSEGVDVDAVVLTVQKPIVTSDAEKLTYSVEDDPEAGSSTFEDIIRKVPQLSIDSEGKVKLNGQSDYVVLVNGRKSGSMSRNFDEVIKSMPASSIKRIEVITNPSMKYSAEGVGGVLNIITDRSSLDGYNGSVSAGFRNYFDNTWGTNESVNFSLQRGRFALTSAFYYSQSWAGDSFYGGEDGTINNLVEGAGYDHMTMSGRRKFDMRNLYGNVNASFQIDSLNRLTNQQREIIADVTQKYNAASRQITTLAEEKKDLNKKVTLAAQLDATNINILAANKRGKKARRVKDIVKFKIDFTIVKNITAETGERTLYIRITKPDNDVLCKNPANTFAYENRELAYSIKKYIEYNGEEQDVTVYWDVEEYLYAGNYRVDIFAEGNLIGSQAFEID